MRALSCLLAHRCSRLGPCYPPYSRLTHLLETSLLHRHLAQKLTPWTPPLHLHHAMPCPNVLVSGSRSGPALPAHRHGPREGGAEGCRRMGASSAALIWLM